MLDMEQQVVMGPYNKVVNGIAALFASYYNFNLQYPNDSSCTLEFIQRYCNTQINILLGCLLGPLACIPPGNFIKLKVVLVHRCFVGINPQIYLYISCYI